MYDFDFGGVFIFLLIIGFLLGVGATKGCEYLHNHLAVTVETR